MVKGNGHRPVAAIVSDAFNQKPHKLGLLMWPQYGPDVVELSQGSRHVGLAEGVRLELVERVDYDGDKGDVSVTFRPSGVKTIAREHEVAA